MRLTIKNDKLPPRTLLDALLVVLAAVTTFWWFVP
jgi:hypothetical protein